MKKVNTAKNSSTPMKNEKKNEKTNLSTVIISAVSAALVLAFLIILIVSALSSGQRVDYLKDDLSKYISISESDYKNYKLDVKFDTIDESDVERQIRKLLFDNKAKDALHAGGYVLNIPISVGDLAYIYYRGYTVDENGIETDVTGACNFFGEIHELGIGSATFIKGIEEGLIGKVPKESASFSLIQSGNVQFGDVIYASYQALLPDGRIENVTKKRIDLSDSYTDSLYGKGFSKSFLGKAIGETIKSAVFDTDEGSIVYSSMKVEAVTRCENLDNVITIDAYFPADYREEALRATAVKFDIYIRGTNVYEVPEYNEEFITETLKITADELEKYDCESIIENHKAMIYEELVKENEESKKLLIEEEMWNHLNSAVKVIALPEVEVDILFGEYKDDINYQFENYYSSYYETVEKFAAAYYGLSSSENYLTYMRTRAKAVLTEKILFYYLIRTENLLPSEEEFEKLFNEAVDKQTESYIENKYKNEIEKLSGEAKEKRIAEIRAEVLRYYGEDYFSESVYYNYAIDDLISYFIVE